MKPQATALINFGSAGLDIANSSGLTAIDNNYQAEQHARHRNQGKPDGIGNVSGLDIFQANTLRLRLTYLLQPMNQLVPRLLQLLGNPHGGYGQQAMARAGVLPIML